MLKAVLSVVAMLLALLLLDLVWITAFMQGLYEREIADSLRAEPNLVAALIFYVGYPLGAYWLAIKPAVEKGSATTALVNGAILGATAYGTFAVTNLAVLTEWSTILTVVDTTWGAFVTSIVCSLGYRIAR